jgi:predicted P-loop ATPase
VEARPVEPCKEPGWGALLRVPDEDELPKAPLIEGWIHYRYCKPDGQIYGYIQRAPDKRIIPLSWCISDEGEEAWRQRAFCKPRLLYGLETLRNAQTVVVVEGEKCADWLRTRCPVPVLTWAGGANAVEHADWEPLRGRRVIVWPDNDEPGRKAAEAIKAKIGGEVLTIPEGKPLGWDCADWTDADGDVVAFLRLDTPAPITAVVMQAGPIVVGVERGEVGSAAWEQYGIRTTARGVPIPNLAGIFRILSEHPHWKGRIWFDEFLERILFQPDSGGEPIEWGDCEERETLYWLQSVFELYNATSSELRDAVKMLARRTVRNEVTEWLRGLQWDGIARAGQLFSRGFGATHNDYVADVGRCYITAAVARAFRPGCKVDTLPILEGSQGAGKSSGLRVLGGRWFSEVHADIREKDFFVVLKGKWILELSEMHSLSKAEVAKVKGILSNQCDRYRIPYESHATDHPRRSVFAGTTNRDDWQIDSTGARRFWPVRCGRVDLDWLQEYRAQVFAEGVAMLDAGGRWWDVAVEAAAAETKMREPSDTWADVLEVKLAEDEHYSTAEIMGGILDVPLRDQDQAKQRRLAEVLRSLGWESKVVRNGYSARRLWVRVT